MSCQLRRRQLFWPQVSQPAEPVPVRRQRQRRSHSPFSPEAGEYSGSNWLSRNSRWCEGCCGTHDQRLVIIHGRHWRNTHKVEFQSVRQFVIAGRNRNAEAIALSGGGISPCWVGDTQKQGGAQSAA